MKKAEDLLSRLAFPPIFAAVGHARGKSSAHVKLTALETTGGWTPCQIDALAQRVSSCT
jgi:hypothetical protein